MRLSAFCVKKTSRKMSEKSLGIKNIVISEDVKRKYLTPVLLYSNIGKVRSQESFPDF